MSVHNILTIDNRPELENSGLFASFTEKVIITSQNQTLHDVAYNLANDKEYSKGKWIIFINLFLACKDEKFKWQQSHAGIALLKFLRMMGIHHHVVLMSPYNRTQLLEQGHANLIITSKGVSLTIPQYHGMYDFSHYSDEKMEELAGETIAGDLKP